MSLDVHHKFFTLCLVQNENHVLLLDRQHDSFSGFIPPGGKVDFPESFTEAAIREVKEETGLDIHDLTYKGLYEYVNPVKKERYIIMNYIASQFSGTIIDDSKEGNPIWVHIDDLMTIPMQKSIRRRIPYMLEEGTFEIHVIWDEEKDQEQLMSIKKT